MNRLLTAIICCFACALPLLAHELLLTDGSVIVGQIIKIEPTKEYVIQMRDGSEIHYKSSMVKSIDLKETRIVNTATVSCELTLKNGSIIRGNMGKFDATEGYTLQLADGCQMRYLNTQVKSVQFLQAPVKVAFSHSDHSDQLLLTDGSRLLGKIMQTSEKGDTLIQLQDTSLLHFEAVFVDKVIITPQVVKSVNSETNNDNHTSTKPNTTWFSTSNFKGSIGLGIPSGENVSDQYGSVWINLGLDYKVAEKERLSHFVVFEINAGMKESKFQSVSASYPDSFARKRARLFALGYQATYKLQTYPIYVGGGLMGGFIDNATEYDAGEGYIWRINGEQKYTVKNKQMRLIPYILGGYNIKSNVVAEVKIRMLKADLPPTDSTFSSVYPSAQSAAVSMYSTVAVGFKFK